MSMTKMRCLTTIGSKPTQLPYAPMSDHFHTTCLYEKTTTFTSGPHIEFRTLHT